MLKMESCELHFKNQEFEIINNYFSKSIIKIIYFTDSWNGQGEVKCAQQPTTELQVNFWKMQ